MPYRLAMSKSRIEAYSDAVIAIIMTIMVLELRPPEGTDWAALQPLVPVFLTYVLSFVYLGIYWNNHHHLFQASTRITGGILWANLNLLFWLSLFPFATGWMGENHAATVPTIAYGLVVLLAALAYYLLHSVMLSVEGPDSVLATALGRDVKGKPSPAIYLVAIVVPSSARRCPSPCSCWSPLSGSSPTGASSAPCAPPDPRRPTPFRIQNGRRMLTGYAPRPRRRARNGATGGVMFVQIIEGIVGIESSCSRRWSAWRT